MFEVFGDGSEPNGLFRVGPHKELVGRSVESLARAEAAGIQVDLIDPPTAPRLEAMPFAPCYFSGRVKSREAIKQPVLLAIAVNGVIQAVTRTYSDAKINERWTAMVPESA